MDDLDFEAQLRAYDERHERRQIATLQRVEQHDQQIGEIRAATERIKAEFEQRNAEIDRQIEEVQEARLQRNLEFDRKLKESDRRFWERLDLFDQQNTALLRRLEQLRERVDLLSGDSRQITDSLVEHKRDPDAHG